MEPEPRGLSKTEARVIHSVEAEGRREFTLDELQRHAGISRTFARKVAHDLRRKGWLQRIRRGHYLLDPARGDPEAASDPDPFRLGSRLVQPYYFGYATAAELWGFLPPADRVCFVATPVRTAARPPGPAQFRFVRIAPAHLFGLRTLHRKGDPIRVSDRERTVLDAIDRPDCAGGLPGAAAILARAKPEIDWKRLERYLGRFRNRSLRLRTGYLAERVRPEVPVPDGWYRRLRPDPGASDVLLGSPREFGRTGTRDPKWHVLQNVRVAELLEEAAFEE